jgi:hypothetical protein
MHARYLARQFVKPGLDVLSPGKGQKLAFWVLVLFLCLEHTGELYFPDSFSVTLGPWILDNGTW